MYRLMKGLHKLSRVDDWKYYDETIRLPSTKMSDLIKVKELMDSKSIGYGYVLLDYVVDAMFVSVYDVRQERVDIKPRSFRGFTVMLRNELGEDNE